MTILTFLGIGFVLGLWHAFDADHILAVTALVSKHKSHRKARILGAFWGLGHTATLLTIGLLVLGLKITITERFAHSFEFMVGIMIAVMGISIFRDIVSGKKRSTAPDHHASGKTPDHRCTSLMMGIIHGMAGSAALMILILSTADSLHTGLAYILVFGIGSMIGMAFASTLISLPFTSKRFSTWNTGVRYMTGISCILFGISMMINIGLS